MVDETHEIVYVEYESTESECFFFKILPQLHNELKTPLEEKNLILDECVYCCHTLEGPQGLFVNIQTYDAVCLENLLLDYALTRCPVYLNCRVKWSVAQDNSDKFQNDLSDASGHPSDTFKIAVNTSSLTFGYMLSLCYIDTQHKIHVYPLHCPWDVVTDKSSPFNGLECLRGSPKIESSVKRIWNQCKDIGPRGVVVWDRPVTCSARIETLRQIPSPPVLNPKSFRCSDCGRTTNLWLHLADGFIGCGRKIYGIADSGCLDGREGAAVRHFEENKETCFLAAKIGTLASSSVDVYSYLDDAMVYDPLLDKHLAHFGIRKEQVVHREKSLAKLEVEHNKTYEWNDKGDPDDHYIKGLGLVGLENYGNTCYMNVALQLLSRVSLLQVAADLNQFHKEIWQLAQNSEHVYIPSGDILLQFSKIMSGLTSATLHNQRSNLLASLNEEEKKAYEEEFPCLVLRPTLFYQISNISHPEFASSRQQDAEEYLRYIVDLLCSVTKEHPLPLAENIHAALLKSFSFTVEEKLRRVSSAHSVRLTHVNEMILSLPLSRICEQPTQSDSLEMGSSTQQQQKNFHSCWLDWMKGEHVTLLDTVDGEKILVEALKTRKMKTFPRYLIIQLGRFYFAEDWTPKKIQDAIEMPTTFDITAYRAHGLASDERIWESSDNDDDDDHDDHHHSHPKDSPTELNQFDSYVETSIQEVVSIGFPESTARSAFRLLGPSATVEQCVDWICSRGSSARNYEAFETKRFSTEPQQTSSKLFESMGFTPIQINAALNLHHGDEQQALEWLVTVGSLVTEEELKRNIQCSPKTPQERQKKRQSFRETFQISEDSYVGKYRLVGFSCHKGVNTNSGHYTFYTLYMPLGSKESIWVCFDDKRVTQCSSSLVNSGYLYLYSKCNDET